MSTLGRRSPAEILASVEAGVLARRSLELDELDAVLEWCEVHSVDPQSQSGAVPVRFGGDRLVAYGGDGTPLVSELCAVELAIARSTGVVATRHAMADALDLAHRLPTTVAAARGLCCDLWVLRRVASMSRRLTKAQVTLVDTAVAAALAQSPRRILEIAEAKIIEADTRAHEERLREQRDRCGVWVERPRPGSRLDDDGTPGVRGVYARAEEGDALAFDRTVDDLADVIADQIAAADQVPGERLPAATSCGPRRSRSLRTRTSRPPRSTPRPPTVTRPPRPSGRCHDAPDGRPRSSCTCTSTSSTARSTASPGPRASVRCCAPSSPTCWGATTCGSLR